MTLGEYLKEQKMMALEEGEVKGREEGLEEGRVEGRAEGRADALKEAIAKLMKAQNLTREEAEKILL